MTECCGTGVVQFSVSIPQVGTRARCDGCGTAVHPDTGEVCEDQEAVF